MLRAVDAFVKKEGFHADCCTIDHYSPIAKALGYDRADDRIVSGGRFFE